MWYNKNSKLERCKILNCSNILNRFFSKTTLLDTIENGQNLCYGEIIKRYAHNENGTNKELISAIYSILGTSYRNEYFYKNTLLNNLIIKKHKLCSTKVLTELPIGKSIADFVTLNGKAVVYEIKTELDNLDRIETQIRDYYKCFPYVCIVTCTEHLNKVKELFQSSNVGIYYFSKRNAIKIIQDPLPDLSQLDYSVMFKVLRKYEFEEVLKCCHKPLPQTTQFDYYKRCFDLFTTIDKEEIYKKILVILKQRCKIELEKFNDVPLELKMLVYQSKFCDTQYQTLFDFLNADYSSGGREDVFSIFEG